MFEDFRKQMGDAPQQDDPPKSLLEDKTRPAGHFLGMTAKQRFFIAIMLLAMVIILGVLFLLVTLKIVPPFMAAPTVIPGL